MRLTTVSRNVCSLDRSVVFYCTRLGFSCAGPRYVVSPAFVRWLGLDGAVQAQRLRLGSEEIELVEVGNNGSPYPAVRSAADLWFQHLAIRCKTIAAACARLRDPNIDALLPSFVSTIGGAGADAGAGGAVTLPASSGGVAAIKFRDPDGHPLELIAFPTGVYPAAKQTAGIDHTAICVDNAGRSIDFYAGLAAMTVGARQVNRGAEQATLDGLDVAVVEVVAMSLAPAASPHLELLAYQVPAPRAPAHPRAPSDIASDRLVFDSGPASGADDGSCHFMQDPDGHFLMLRCRSDQARSFEKFHALSAPGRL